ncbi:MAG: bifunctional 4-hydroxy-2-oxoglutarate aldolase/2-dehydro-3-deoxy-phosphogluconate aldolase [Oscillospiraceae bacterium]|nr:bifunctional 4-hydroxy-2-oxoglutarate aldolase/2-dehydro-3-deoxy-phosphogluconate aldolase [Oscillospiraceae bacterium]
MNEILNKIKSARIIPVITIHDSADAVPLCRALSQGGLAAAEITFRTDAAEESLRRVAAELPDVLLGAGTVLSVETVQKAVSAGAGFIVSPGFNPAVVSYCTQNNILVIPGVCTPSEVEMGLSHGLNTLKFFPAEAAGGVRMLKALSAPYGGVSFMPTGGITPANIAEYLALKSVIACGGSWMAGEELIRDKNWAEITRIARQATGL